MTLDNRGSFRLGKQDKEQDKLKIKLKVISWDTEKFSRILHIDGLKSSDIVKSLILDDNIANIYKAGVGVGKSGSFFFYSSDSRFILKTMKGSEKKVILDILDDLINYYQAVNNQSLIAKIYGVFTIKTNIFNTIHVLIM